MTKDEKIAAVLGCLLVIPMVLGVLVLSALYALLPALIAWALWNHALAALVHGPQITFLQAFALLWVIGFIVRLASKP